MRTLFFDNRHKQAHRFYNDLRKLCEASPSINSGGRLSRERYRLLMIMDCHVHLFPREVRKDRSRFFERDFAFASIYSTAKARLASEDQIIRYLDDSGIDRAVVFGFPWADPELVKQNNDEIWDFHQRNQRRIVPFAILSPRGGDVAALEAQRTLTAGFGGVGELAMYHGGWSEADFEALTPSVELARQAQVPVLIHVNEPVGHHYPGKIAVNFQGLLQIISDYPDVDFILAHFGGGLFVYGLMPEVGKVLGRTYLDTAASPFLYDSRVFDIACRIMGPDKILFGSDFPLLPLSRYLKELEKADLRGEIRAGILGENLRSLLDKKTVLDNQKPNSP